MMSISKFHQNSLLTAYLILILPLSIVRFIRFTHHSISEVADIYVDAWFNLIGFVDVVLFFVTKASFGIF